MKKLLILTAMFCFASLGIAVSITFEKIKVHPFIDRFQVNMIRSGEDYIDIYLNKDVYRSNKSFKINSHKDSKGLFGDDEWIRSADYINGEIAIGSTNGLNFYDEDFNPLRYYSQEKDTLVAISVEKTMYDSSKDQFIVLQSFANLFIIDSNDNISQSVHEDFFVYGAIYDIEVYNNKYYISLGDPAEHMMVDEKIYITDTDFNILETVFFDIGKEETLNSVVRMFKSEDYMFYYNDYPTVFIVEDLKTHDLNFINIKKHNSPIISDVISVNGRIIISSWEGLFELNKITFELEKINIVNNIDNHVSTKYYDLEIIDDYCYVTTDKGIYRANLSAFTNVEFENTQTTQLINGRITNKDIPFDIKVYNSLGEIRFSKTNITELNLNTELNSTGVYFITVETRSGSKVFKYLKSE